MLPEVDSSLSVRRSAPPPSEATAAELPDLYDLLIRSRPPPTDVGDHMRRLLRPLTITVLTAALAAVGAASAYADPVACRGAFHSDSRLGPQTLQSQPVGPL